MRAPFDSKPDSLPDMVLQEIKSTGVCYRGMGWDEYVEVTGAAGRNQIG